MPDQQHCFVVMPFALKDVDKTRYEDQNHWTEVYEGLIAPALKTAGITCERDDRDIGSRLIVEGFLRKIESADLVLCDLSSHNPNVFLELGWALRADKPYVLIKDDLTEFTFDLGQQYTLEYDHRLQPTVLTSETDKLATVVTKTLEDAERRYSVVRSLAISSEAIQAADKGEYQTQILLDIQRRLLSGSDTPVRRQDPRESFPWPDLLQRAMHVLFSIRDERPIVPADSDEFRRRFRQRTVELGVAGQRDLQVSIVTDQRIFAYHDWDKMIGGRARYAGADGNDMYDPVLSYPHGVVAWLDRTTNVPGNLRRPTWRANVAVFSTFPNSQWRIIVETHHELP